MPASSGIRGLDAGGHHDLVVRRQVGRGRLGAERARRPRAPRAGACSSAASRGSPPCRAPASPAGTGRRSTPALEQGHREPALGGRHRRGEAGRSGADHGDRFRGAARRGRSRPASVSRQARGLTRQEAFWFSKTWSRQAWLQAMQVLISSARPAAALSTKSASARNGRAIETRSASPAARIDSASSGVLIRLDAHDRHRHLGLAAGRSPTPGAARDLGDDRRHPRLVPADAGVEDGDAGLLEQVGELDDLVPGLAALDQVEQRDPVDDREVGADQLAGPAHHLDREPHPVARRPAPLVGAVVGAGGEELVDQVALGAHDLDGVVPGLLARARRTGRSRWPVRSTPRGRQRASAGTA